MTWSLAKLIILLICAIKLVIALHQQLLSQNGHHLTQCTGTNGCGFFPILLGVQMFLRYFDVKGKIHCMSTLFGLVVRIIDFLQGPEMEDVEGEQNNSFNSIPTLE